MAIPPPESKPSYAAMRGWAGRQGFTTVRTEKSLTVLDEGGSKIVAIYQEQKDGSFKLASTTQRKVPPAPPKPTAFEKQSKSRSKKATAEQAIKERLTETADKLSYDSKIRTHEYKDGTVDGEILVMVPRGVSTSDLLLDLENAFEKQSLGSGFWISIGERHTIREDDEVYRRFKGMNEVQTNYQRMTPTNIAETLLIARQRVTPGMEKKYRRKAELVYIRIHWNRKDKQPKWMTSQRPTSGKWVKIS
jgi:hypothetical protein